MRHSRVARGTKRRWLFALVADPVQAFPHREAGFAFAAVAIDGAVADANRLAIGGAFLTVGGFLRLPRSRYSDGRRDAGVGVRAVAVRVLAARGVPDGGTDAAFLRRREAPGSAPGGDGSRSAWRSILLVQTGTEDAAYRPATNGLERAPGSPRCGEGRSRRVGFGKSVEVSVGR